MYINLIFKHDFVYSLILRKTTEMVQKGAKMIQSIYHQLIQLCDCFQPRIKHQQLETKTRICLVTQKCV